MEKVNEPTDRTIILEYRGGNSSKLSVLVKRYHRTLCEKAYWITKDKELAKDIAQESWITILNKLHTLKDVDKFKNWALRIIYTKAIDSIKLKKIEKNLSDFRTVFTIEQQSDGNEKSLLLTKILKAIKKLPEDKQNIIRLFYHEDYSITEIATFLDIPIGTVKSRLFKAREKLKSLLNCK